VCVVVIEAREGQLRPEAGELADIGDHRDVRAGVAKHRSGPPYAKVCTDGRPSHVAEGVCQHDVEAEAAAVGRCR